MSFFERFKARNRPWATVIGSAALFVGAVCLGDDLQNRQFLETLPRDRRATLAENLDRFDRLNGAEQTAIRRFDKEIEKLEPEEQPRYRALLQQYHLWFQGLTDDQRTALLATTDLDERFRLARKFRLAEMAGPKRDGPRIAKIRTGDYGLIPPTEMAYFLKIWRDLPPEKRSEIEKKPFSKVRDELRSQAKKINFKFEPFPADQEKIYDEKLEKDDEFKPLIEQMARKVEQAVKKSEALKKAEAVQKRFEHPYAEFLYFEEHHPTPVDPGRLNRFGEWCPEWLHALTDSMSADDAREYLTILYRSIYPIPNEMPEPSKPTKRSP